MDMDGMGYIFSETTRWRSEKGSVSRDWLTARSRGDVVQALSVSWVYEAKAKIETQQGLTGPGCAAEKEKENEK